MNKTNLLDAIGNTLMDIMESYEIDDEEVIESLLMDGLSVREINMLGLFDKKEVKSIQNSLQNEQSAL